MHDNILFLLVFGFFSSSAFAEINVERLANAIKHAENSQACPYGIRSINTHRNEAYARKICINSIKNNYKRWVKQGRREDFITFMGRRYSPPSINPNWVRLVKYFYKKGG